MRKWNKIILVLIAIIFGLSLWYVLPTRGSGIATRDLMLASSDGAISGAVMDFTSNQLVADLEVKLTRDGGDTNPINTDESGVFSFTSLKPGSYSLEIARDDYDTISYKTVIDSGEQVYLNLYSMPSTVSIKGDVRNSVSDEPVENVILTIQEKTSTDTTSVATDSIGRYGFTLESEGTYFLAVSNSDYQAVDMITLEYTGDAITQPIVIEPKPSKVSGIVSTLTENTLANAVIVLTQDGNEVVSATSDADGVYSIAEVPQGTYIMKVTQGAYLEKSLLLKVSANGTITQNVTLSPSNISIEGSVLDQNTQSPIAGATVTVRKTPKKDETSEVMYTTVTDEQGRYALGGMPHGMSLTLTASKTGYDNVVRSTQKISISSKGFHFGLDLKGGSQIILKADFDAGNIAEEDHSSSIKGAISIIEKRINGYGVSDPVVQKVGSDRILIELPGIKNTDEAVNLIGQTAELEFKLQKLDASGNPILDENGDYVWETASGTNNKGELIELTGQYFKGNVEVRLNSLNKPEVAFEWESEAADVFGQVTSNNVGKPLGIFLDDKMISAPTIEDAITEGKGVITGLSLNEARNLVTQLKSGALPVPLEVVERHDVDPTLGPNVIKKCLIAGALGLLAVFLFMTIYYRLPGLLCGGALIVYVAVVLAIFKIIPVTLTLAGIGGFIVSIGMAVDANVIIFERLKEELRNGRAIGPATDIAFNRAWPAIRDSNFTTFIACGILYWLGSTLGVHPVQGFAITLFFGVAVSMLSAIIMTRAFMIAITNRSWAKKPWQYLGMGDKSNV